MFLLLMLIALGESYRESDVLKCIGTSPAILHV